MSSKRTKILFTSLAILFVALLTYYFTRPKEPTYQGKPLGHYLFQMALLTSDKYNDDTFKPVRAIGPKAIPYLLQAFHKKDSASVKILTFLHDHLPSGLARHVPAPNPHLLKNMAAASAYCLAALGPNAKEALPDLINSFADRDRIASIWFAVGQIGPQAENLPALLPLLNSTNMGAPYFAADCIGQMGITNAAVLTSLTKLVENKDADLSRSAVIALGQLGDKAAQAIPVLTRRLDSPDSNVRITAAAALQKIQSPQAISVTWMVHELDQELNHGSPPSQGFGPHEWNLLNLCDMLRALKTEAQPAVPLLRTARDSQDRTFKPVARMVQLRAAQALLEINHETNNLMPLCLESFKHIEVKHQAAFLLNDFCLDQRIALPELYEMLDSPELAIRVRAARVVSKLNAPSDKILPIMIFSLEDHFIYGTSTRDLQCLAAEALGEMGAKARPAIPALTLALKDPDEKVRTAAAKALKQIAPESIVK